MITYHVSICSWFLSRFFNSWHWPCLTIHRYSQHSSTDVPIIQESFLSDHVMSRGMDFQPIGTFPCTWSITLLPIVINSKKRADHTAFLRFWIICLGQTPRDEKLQQEMFPVSRCLRPVCLILAPSGTDHATCIAALQAAGWSAILSY